MLGQFHQLPSARLVCSLDEHSANRVHAEGLFVLLLSFDEVVVGSEFLEHVGHWHGAAICFVAEVNDLVLGSARGKAQGKSSVITPKPATHDHFKTGQRN